ncbi:MAG TPA: PhzF family phenazine biosynthesis protein [Burkholderiaceae bacterium]
MRLPLYQVDTFASRAFGGNPAAVVPLDAFPDDALMQAIAAENNLSETAFLVPQGEDFALRWFTPAVEVPLCGHATLASAAVVMERLQPGRERVVFHTRSGPLPVRRAGQGYELDFPARDCAPVPQPADLEAALGARVLETVGNEFILVARLRDAAAVRALRPDFATLRAVPAPSIAVTAEGDDGFDIVSRFFAPAKGVDEDPVTGSAHCTLVPWWARRLGRDTLRAWQASPRGGEIGCRLEAGRVLMQGRCVFFLEGRIEV